MAGRSAAKFDAAAEKAKLEAKLKQIRAREAYQLFMSEKLSRVKSSGVRTIYLFRWYYNLIAC